MLSFLQESFSCSKRLFEGILAQEVPSKGACLASGLTGLGCGVDCGRLCYSARNKGWACVLGVQTLDLGFLVHFLLLIAMP